MSFAWLLLLSPMPLLPASQDAPPPYAVPGEEAVDPYTVAPENAGARAFEGTAMAEAFGGQPGIRRIVDRLVVSAFDDPKIGEIFQPFDRVRLNRTLFEQFCFILNAGCTYTGRDMRTSHKDMGVTQANMNRLVELLQGAMKAEGVSFAAQNRFLAKLAPMRGDVVKQ